ADLVRFDQDCASLSLAIKEEPAPADWKVDYAQFMDQAGKPEGTRLKLDKPPSVRLAFLDTQPTAEGVPRLAGKSQHGYTLAHIARHLVCTDEPPERCAAQITTQLALPIIDFDPKKRAKNEIDTAGQGGFLGRQSDLAAAIRQEVDTWLD